MAEYLRDTFTRSSASGWGTGEVGGVWTESLANTLSTVGGTAARWQFQGTTLASTAHARVAAATAARDVHMAMRVRIDSSELTGTGTGVQLWLWLRAGGVIGTPTGYFARVNVKTDGSAILAVGYSTGSPVVLGSYTFPAGTLVAGSLWILEAYAIGAPSKVGARFWNAATVPPPAGNVGWIIAGDELGTQTAGVYGISADRPSLAVAAAQVLDFSETFATDPPVPAFTYSQSAPLVANFNASSSTGDFTAYSWNWGDGTAAGSGSTPTHTYAGPGTYKVTLTGTTRWTATYTAAQYVTVAAAPPPDPAPPEPVVLIAGVDVCDELYSITWSSGRRTWAEGFTGATCSLRLRGIYAAQQGQEVTIAVPKASGGQPLWSGVIDQVFETHELDSARSETSITAMDTASQLARQHINPPQILPSVTLPGRLGDLRGSPPVTFRYRYSSAPVLGGRWLQLKKKTQADDKIRERTYLELISDALTASLAIGYVARDGAIAYAPWEAPPALASTPRIDLDSGLDCASRVELDRNSVEGIVNRWTGGGGSTFDVPRNSSIETYGERTYAIPGETLVQDTDFPFAITRWDGLVTAMGNPRAAATAEIPVVDWAQLVITAQPLDLATYAGQLYAVVGVRHTITLGDVWRVELELDRNPWEIDGRSPP